MTSDEQQVVEQVVRQLVDTFPIERIVLFGSRARGDADIDSDYDFLIIMDTDVKPSRRALMVRQKGLVTGVPMDFMVRTPDEWQRGFPLKKEIVAEGKIIYCPNRGAFLLAYATTAPTLGRLRTIICA